MRGRPVQLLIAVVVLGQLLLIGLWPCLRGTALRQAAGPVQARLCHQLPERCYRLGGEPMPVCARCLGVWVGLFLAAALAFLGVNGSRPALAWALVGWLMASWLLGQFLLPAHWHLERTVAGLAGGLGAHALLKRAPGWAVRRWARFRDKRGRLSYGNFRIHSSSKRSPSSSTTADPTGGIRPAPSRPTR